MYFLPGMLVLAMAIAFLFFVKNRVQDLSRNIKTVNTKILSEREKMHVLRAEYSYLTNPKRLKKLADKSLALRAPSNDQILDTSQIEIYLNSFVAPQDAPLSEANN
jgi:cell division protein FtsL